MPDNSNSNIIIFSNSHVIYIFHNEHSTIHRSYDSCMIYFFCKNIVSVKVIVEHLLQMLCCVVKLSRVTSVVSDHL